jgi:enterochelin esterase family protein
MAAFVYNAGPDSRAEELPCNPRFAQFVATELLPWLRARYAPQSEPRDICLAGSSFGGLAASYIALEYPGLFGKVLSQSGSYWWSFPRGHASFDGSAEPGWLRRRYEKKARAPLELYLSAGTFETAAAPGGVLEHNRLQRDALRELGYTVAYQELVAGHDPLSWRASIPDALIALFARAP